MLLYCSMEPASSENGTQHNASEANAWVPRLPPSSRAIKPASKVTAACAMPENRR